MGNKVLVVEDNDLNRKLFRDLLKTIGVEVVELEDGHLVKKTAEEESPDLILMDIQLHGISGYDIIKELKQDSKLKKIPIIAVTAFAMKDDKEKIMKSGCEEYIAKPIFINPFLETVKKYLKI